MTSVFKAAAAAGLIVAGAAALSGCAQMNPMRYVPQRGCENLSVTIYFETGSDQLTQPARQIIRATEGATKACRIKEIHLTGLADPSGSPQANLDLSKRRAQAVLEAFQAAGFKVTRYHIVAAGDKGAVTRDGEVEPLRRQVIATLVTGREPRH